jgi:hypothetical protein
MLTEAQNQPMLDPQRLYEFLSHLSVVEQGEPELRDDLHRAMKHFVKPLISEFYGVSMVALKKMLASNRRTFSAGCHFRERDPRKMVQANTLICPSTFFGPD